MEYERIHKVQTGLLSPSKLRMKLLGPNHQKKKDSSNSNSARTSPSKLEDSEFVKNSLLDVQNGVEEEGPDSSSTMQQRECMPRENGDSISSKVLQSLRGDNANTGTLHPAARACDDENLDYDSTSSFEFHKERSHPQHVARSFSRPMPSKWNDAEKWIMNRQNFLPASSKKMHFPYQSNRVSAINTGRVVPEAANHEHKPSVKRVDFCLPGPQPGSEKLAFVPNGLHPVLVRGDGENALIDLCPESKDLMEVDNTLSSCTKGLTENTSGIPSIRSVSMRDMGTEMTPIPSQEPSRTATPVGATTPLRSPASSIPSTPRRGEPAPTPVELYISNAPQSANENRKRDMSDQEIKLKTRREIVALGVQLGKMNIAAWASKDEKDRASAFENDHADELQQIEFVKRAAAWEEAEKAKHVARYKREEIKIQAWESQQKAKLEAEMRRTEAQVEQLRAQAQAKMVKKLAMASQKSDEKRVAAEARKNRHAQKVAAKAEYIRQSGRLPSSSFICCGWS